MCVCVCVCVCMCTRVRVRVSLSVLARNFLCACVCVRAQYRMFSLFCIITYVLVLQNNKYLRELDLSHNKFTEIGAEVLGHAIGE